MDLATGYLIRKWNLMSPSRLQSCSNCRCGSLDKLLTSVSSNTGSWYSSLSTHEAVTMIKKNSNFGGVLCCRNVSCTSCNDENKICIPKNWGCSDGSREWFVDRNLYPDIAGCAGAFDRPGLNNSSPSCSRKTGNSAVDTSGTGCSAADLCEVGWKVCDSLMTLLSSSGGRFCDTSRHVSMPSGSFYASAITSEQISNTCQDYLPPGGNLVGCGNVELGSYCEMNGKHVFSSVQSPTTLSSTWNLPSGTLEDMLTSATKTFSMTSGVLCCRESLAVCEDCGGSTGKDCDLDYLNTPFITVIHPGNGSSEGEEFLTIRGQNFGGTGQVLMDGRPCRPESEEKYTNFEIVCLTPSLRGGNVSVIVVNDKSHRSIEHVFVVNPPEIHGITSSFGRRPTDGNVVITITGRNFGDESATIRIGGQECNEILWAHTHNTISCNLPSGQGKDLALSVDIFGRMAHSLFSYDPPMISSIYPLHSSTEGGTRISIYGSNFGSNGIVFIGNQECSTNSSIMTWDHGIVECLLPPGEGKSVFVVVSVSEQNSSQGEANYSYAAPIIDSISSAYIDFSYSSLSFILINGYFFGTRPKIVWAGKILDSALMSSEDQTFINATLPVDLSGRFNEIQVLALDQFSQCSGLSCSISVSPPIIVNVKGCVDIESGGTKECPLSGEILITVSGYNFGQNASIFIQRKLCILVNMSIDEESRLLSYVCLLPENLSGAINALVEVESDGQVGKSRLLSYQCPAYISNSLRHCIEGETQSSKIGNLSSSGGEAICMDILDLPQDLLDSELRIWYGSFDLSDPTYDDISALSPRMFNCSNAIRLISSTVRCITSQGTGADLKLLIQVRKQVTWSLNDSIAYLTPILVPGTIRGENGPSGDSFVSRSSLGDSIYFDVLNFNVSSLEFIWPDIQILYGFNDSTIQFECVLKSVSASGTPGVSTINCLSEPGEGANLTFVMYGLNQISSRIHLYLAILRSQ